MSEPLVSVIVAAYNAEKYLVDCVKSIQMQTYLNWELIICDDNSSDRTLAIALELAQEDNRIRVLHNETNLFAGGRYKNQLILKFHSSFCFMVYDSNFNRCTAIYIISDKSD